MIPITLKLGNLELREFKYRAFNHMGVRRRCKAIYDLAPFPINAMLFISAMLSSPLQKRTRLVYETSMYGDVK